MSLTGAQVRHVVVACDAGMGSSVLLTSQLAKRFKPLGVTVAHAQVDSIPAGTQVVVCQQGLADRARSAAPGAVVVPFRMFMGDPAFDRLEQALRDDTAVVA